MPLAFQPSTGSIAIQLNKYCTPAKGKPSKEQADLGFGGTDVKTRGFGFEFTVSV